MQTHSPDQLLTVSQVAEELNVHPQTVRAWIRAGSLKAHHTPGGHARITRAALDEACGIPRERGDES